MSRAAITLALVTAGIAIAAPPKSNDPPWLIARLGNDRFRQKDAVSALTYSPDNKYLASADDETIHIWDAADGRRVRSIPIENHKSFALRYTSDGRTLLAAAMDDRSTRLIQIDPTTGKVRSNLAIRAGKAEGKFSDDGRWLVVKPDIPGPAFGIREAGSEESLVHVVNVATGGDWTVKLDDFNLAYSFAFKQDGSAVAVGTNEGRVCIFESRSGRMLVQYQLQQKPIDLAFSPDGTALVMAHRHEWDRRITKIDLATGKEIWTCRVNDVVRIAVVDGGKKVLYFGTDEKTHRSFCWFWLDAKTGKPTGEFLDAGTGPAVTLTYGRPIAAVTLSNDGHTFCQGSSDGAISQWDLRSCKRLPASCDPPVDVRELTIVANSTKVRGYSRGWYEWNVKTGAQTRLTPAIGLGVSETFAISADSAWLARTVQKPDWLDWQIEFKNLATGKVHRSSDFVSQVAQFRFLPDGSLAAVHKEGITVFDPASGKTKVHVEGGRLRLTDDGKSIVQIDRQESHVKLVRWSLENGKIASEWTGDVSGLGEGHHEVGSDNYFSPDGRLAVLKSERMVAPNVTECHTFLVETATGKLRATWGGSRCSGVRFTPDRRSIVEYNLRPFYYVLREVVTGGYRAQVLMRGTSVNDFAFSPDARKLIVSTQPYPIEIWDAIGEADKWDAWKPEALWEALANNDAEKAYKSIHHLLANPTKAAMLLKERVKVPESPSTEWIKDRLKALDAAQFRDREKATADLAAVGELVLPTLREAAKKSSEEALSRLKPLIEKAEVLTPEKLRAIRMCEVLEGLGTLEATTLLDSWARGAPGATLTREAKESLARIQSHR